LADNVIELGGVSKRFRISREPAHTMKEAAINFVRRRNDREEFWALRDVSMSVKRGESVGVIGRNGSGKSTLFRLISGVLKPTAGSIRVRGRLSPMIELTAGFHPELTGMENIYLNCAIYGMGRAETGRKVGEILDFAEIGDFIYSPVRVYSSGMLARLGFAVAVNVDADVLLIDEVLAVGDAEFQRKCFDRIKELKRSGTTFVYVSHDLATVQDLCERAIWMDAGTIKDSGGSKGVISDYYNFVMES
jgi:lipopolysaccharide transport system ATP-binding protein